ncbi:ATP-binding cassette domain-containing protein [Apilactobacillus micheneri]|uniref:ATP-binding cassette domain-containing protein n=1 Tax=Apilactobacillus micheneri TaxID=1899430 RepID=A0ABY2Z0Y4_9LACO|nr:ATP-binding cassette domain-containing protein [Apilactobacillus micheneri]TPR24610.1 ATP-binding cassette domain-containing protein [Apilactobacillus micheneri]TPR25921.1 ATP-binding cassette domain-containing protein [Apilactobacillus micheneri]TPR28111.1 ATP-binding cassette domain-containing protein [Apilactobacillus micheneri]TPR29602.1 ATP-binding cassette domain-containing protein [Apilactobacillus micheneri]TPR30388.1 ATP-binding cassette domain-containing protein [Apilactobacillus 
MIEFKNVSKNYDGFQAVSNLSFQLHKGEILSLIGQNGAGKSTTFHMLLDFIKPSNGQIHRNNNLNIGYMPEERGLYLKESIKSQMIYFASLHGMKRVEALEKLKIWMEKLNVVGDIEDKVESLSKGNAQKVQLIACLMFNPDLLILDEPFSGLDPVNADLLIKAVLEAKKSGTMIIFSTHNMENVEKLSDYVVMLSHGKTVLKGTLKDIYNQFGRSKLDIVGYNNLQRFKGMNGIKDLAITSENSAQLTLNDVSFGKYIFDEVTKDGYIPVFNQHYPTLDEIFKEKVKESEK